MILRVLTPYGQRCLIGALVVLALLLMAALAHAADVTLAWNASTSTSVTGYRVHYGQATATYSNTVDAGAALTKVVTGLTPGQRYFFAATAYDGWGQVSSYSNEVVYTVPLPPPPLAPTNLRVIPVP